MTNWRIWIRSLEFRAPVVGTRAFLRLTGKAYQPYAAYHDALRAIFVHIPKTAGTSVTHALFEARPRHLPLSRFLAADPDRFARYFKFAFVRNPWDRMHSAYVFLADGSRRGAGEHTQWARRHLSGCTDFAQFITSLDDPRKRRAVLSWVHFRPQSDWLRVNGSTHACDFLGRFESLDEDLAVVWNRLGVHRSIPHKRFRGRGDYREAYSRRMSDMVGEWYSEDVKAFGYRF